MPSAGGFENTGIAAGLNKGFVVTRFTGPDGTNKKNLKPKHCKGVRRLPPESPAPPLSSVWAGGAAPPRGARCRAAQPLCLALQTVLLTEVCCAAPTERCPEACAVHP